MADFNSAWNISKHKAGGYVNDPQDIGKETYRDISRKFNPQWVGWSAVDALKKQRGGSLPKNFISPELDVLASKFYKTTFWDKVQGDRIKDQSVANQIFDQTLDGLGRANQMVQLVLNNEFGGSFKLSNTVSTGVIDKLNSVNPKKFFDKFKEYRLARFQYAGGILPSTHPLYSFFKKFDGRSDQARKEYGAKYVSGWLNRVNDFAYSGIDFVKKNPVTVAVGVVSIVLFTVTVVYFISNKEVIA